MDMNWQEARSELNRCREALQWSWLKTGELLDLSQSQMEAVKQGKRDLAPGDVEWMQALAEAVQTVPARATFRERALARAQAEETMPPMLTTEGARSTLRPLETATANEELDVSDLPPVPFDDVPLLSLGRQRARMEAVMVLASIYAEATGNEALSVDNSDGARWAISQAAERMGLLAEVQAEIAGRAVLLPTAKRSRPDGR